VERSPIRKISEKKSKQIQEEVEIRKQLWDRCGGKCEECGGDGYPFGIHPHEKIFKSQGGRMSLTNSIMLCNTCHGRYGHNLKIAED
jgi:5-methylcytosine-specific restriction endonuclease McrA